MAFLGTYGLMLGLVLSVGGAVIAAIGARTDRPALVETARRIAFAVLATMVVVDGAMLAALLSNDFTLRYVAENSSRETPVFFKVLSLWAADDGSLLFWNLILAGYVAAVAVRFRRYRPPTFPYALSVLFGVQAFYLILVNGPARPFGTLAQAAADGRGPAPLLQNHPLMAVHPPFLYLGFIGFTVPFAFGVAALLAGTGSDAWVSIIRRWTLLVWCFLTVGLVLGALWSYSVLGWGGYWAWDPVENVALLPWLVATAFLHSIMLQERRGMARLWNIALVIGAFALTTFGTFLTRGSVLSSVHAFAQSAVGPAYLAFLGVVLLGGFGLVAWRLPQLRTPARLESTVSREAAIVGNNMLLLAATAIILLGTVLPLAVEALTGDQITVGGPYFQSALAPVFLLVLVLAGTAPLLPWRAVNRAAGDPAAAAAGAGRRARGRRHRRGRAARPLRGGRLRRGHAGAGRRRAGDRQRSGGRAPARRRAAHADPRPPPVRRADRPHRTRPARHRDHRVEQPGRADPGHPAHRAEHRVRRPHPPVRRAGDRPAGPADRAHRQGGRERQRAADPADEPLPGRLRADRLAVDPPRRAA